MKKLVILFLSVVSLFLLTTCACVLPNDACCSVDESISIEGYDDTCRSVNERIYIEGYNIPDSLLYLSRDLEDLAVFLLTEGMLGEFVDVDTEDYSATIEKAVTLFSEDENIRKKALEKVIKVHIDCNWDELCKIVSRSDDFESYEGWSN